MTIPKNITKEHLLKAIQKIDSEGFPNDANSQYYDVLHNGKRYPPKVIVSYSNIYANGFELDRNDFNGGANTPAFRLLKEEGFEIVPKNIHTMQNVFVFTSSNAEAQKHLLDTVENPIDKNKLLKHIDSNDVGLIEEAAGDFYAWGATPGPNNERNWGQLKQGDYILNYSRKQYHHYSKIIFKIRNKELAKDLWGIDNEGNTWEFIYFFEKPIHINPPVDAESLSKFFPASFQGFSKIKEDRVSLILNEFKSLDNFFEIIFKMAKNVDDPKVWFVTQGHTFTEEVGMKFLWAPEKGKDGNARFYWQNVFNVKKGDIIFNYSEGELKGVSLAFTDGYKTLKPENETQWNHEGYRVDIELIKLVPPLKSDIFSRNILTFNEYLLSIRNKPFSVNGSINQGYLYEFTKEAGRYIRDIYQKPFGNKTIDDFFDKVKLTTPNIIQMEDANLSILTAIKTKPFILLAGISGTGKSRLVRTLAFQTCSKPELQTDNKKPGNFELIPVRPNWHDSSELMGYVSRINGDKYIVTSFLQFIAKAWKHLEVPFFLCLDEMNLAPVEQYFAEYLSVIETRQVIDGEIVTDFLIAKASFEDPELYDNLLTKLGLTNDSRFIDGISIPSNLIVMGTVNMDETTHSFSRKVLDRAMTFEMNNVDLTVGLEKDKNDWSYPDEFITADNVLGNFTSGAEVNTEFAEANQVIDFLVKLNLELEGTPFKIAYRVRDEFLIYCYYASLNKSDGNWLTKALDEMTSMKILSRIEGDEAKTGKVLTSLLKILPEEYKTSNAKIKEMEARLSSSGYTSFWS